MTTRSRICSVVLSGVLLFVSVSLAAAQTATLAWDPNAEADLAGYRLRYGTQPGVYTQQVDVGNRTTYEVTGLTPGQAYYFAVQAYSTHGLVSPLSSEVSHVATARPLYLPWEAYNATGGGIRVAAGDLDGDGLDEIVAGLDSGGHGWIAVFDDAAHNHAFLKWIQLDWPEYNAANGEVWPAVGDVDGDGKAEIVAGLGRGGYGWFAILDDATAEYSHIAWRQVAWASYIANGSGATHPAIGNVNGIGASEIIVGLGTGGAGWLEVFSGSATNYRHQSWFQVDWAPYNQADGTTFPAAGDIDGDGRAEIVAGLGAGGLGWLEMFGDATGGFAHTGWIRTSWDAYNRSATARTHPSIGNIDDDAASEIVVGLGAFPNAAGWFEVFDDRSANSASLGWRQFDPAAFNAKVSVTFPAVGLFR